jgi:enamine deaminase RidA (YjgF/YER057c/UK114 family)
VVQPANPDSEVERRLAELGFTVPDPVPAIANYVGAVQTGNLVFISGHGPFEGGKLAYTGKLGQDLDVDAGRKAAELVALQCMGSLKQLIGNLDRVKRIVKVLGMVNSAPDFGNQPEVIDGASNLLVHMFGEARGKHARSAVGMGALPRSIAVEIEMVVEVD